MCDDGTNCVSLLSVCNGRQDCYDGTDELNCTSAANDHTHMYQVSRVSCNVFFYVAWYREMCFFLSSSWGSGKSSKTRPAPSFASCKRRGVSFERFFLFECAIDILVYLIKIFKNGICFFQVFHIAFYCQTYTQIIDWNAYFIKAVSCNKICFLLASSLLAYSKFTLHKNTYMLLIILNPFPSVPKYWRGPVFYQLDEFPHLMLDGATEDGSLQLLAFYIESQRRTLDQ